MQIAKQRTILIAATLSILLHAGLLSLNQPAGSPQFEWSPQAPLEVRLLKVQAPELLRLSAQAERNTKSTAPRKDTQIAKHRSHEIKSVQKPEALEQDVWPESSEISDVQPDAPSERKTDSSVISLPATSAVNDHYVPPSPSHYRISNAEPVYPPYSRELGEEGRVLLAILISNEGYPVKIDIRSSSGYSRLDQAALTAVRKWRFRPAQHGGITVQAEVMVPITFSLHD